MCRVRCVSCTLYAVWVAGGTVRSWPLSTGSVAHAVRNTSFALLTLLLLVCRSHSALSGRVSVRVASASRRHVGSTALTDDTREEKVGCGAAERCAAGLTAVAPPRLRDSAASAAAREDKLVACRFRDNEWFCYLWCGRGCRRFACKCVAVGLY